MILFAEHSPGWERIEGTDVCFGVFPLDDIVMGDAEQIQRELEAEAAKFMGVPKAELAGGAPMADAVYEGGVMVLYFRPATEVDPHESERTA